MVHSSYWQMNDRWGSFPVCFSFWAEASHGKISAKKETMELIELLRHLLGLVKVFNESQGAHSTKTKKSYHHNIFYFIHKPQKWQICSLGFFLDAFEESLKAEKKYWFVISSNIYSTKQYPSSKYVVLKPVASFGTLFFFGKLTIIACEMVSIILIPWLVYSETKCFLCQNSKTCKGKD